MNLPMPWKIDDILNATRGEVLCGKGSDTFKGISIDSRKITKTDLFVAITGENHDGHSFVKEVLEKGISGCVISKKSINKMPVTKWGGKNITCVAVDDTTRALGDLARFQRRRSKASVIAITGSNGKTTTRGLVSCVMEQKFATISTIGNFNNEIGLPLTLFQLSKNHEKAVVELGMNHMGEIRALSKIAEPDIGIITNIGPAHLEGVGSLDGVMHAKGELLDEIKKTGTAILNADDPRILNLAEKTQVPILFFGISKKAAVRALSIEPGESETVFTLVLPTGKISIQLGVPGKFMVSNALAAAATGYQAGLSLQEIKTGIERFQPSQGRMNIIKSKGINIIDDAYNANPDSMKSAIHTLLSLKGKKRGILVLGDMLELGEHAVSLHQDIGALAADTDIHKVYATGHYAGAIEKGARDGNMDADKIFTGTYEEILEHLKKDLTASDWILVKGSRGLKMETIVQGLLKR
ncbi:MAG: UDP-N-acetylmuramoyl-tripeptide--D-alanyl-D-alanine ligase [Desulfobacterales bacterium]|nr:UDP-N-acetylmuramoyl-tripeptide--D-alanyl-D-alanine ligase [Desulfobacterales bacterium]